MMNKLIELKNLTKNFDDQQVLRGINLDIYEKEFLTLLGPESVIWLSRELCCFLLCSELFFHH